MVTLVDSTTSSELSLTLEQVRERLGRAPLVPIYREILADHLTPVVAYRALEESGPAFLLESVEGGERIGRYSFVAADPRAIVTVDNGRAEVTDARGKRFLTAANPMDAVEQYLAAFRAQPVEGLPERFCGGAVGYFGYEAARYLERLPVPDADPVKVPEAVLLVTDTLVCFDHVLRRVKLVTHVRGDEGPTEAAYAAARRRIDQLLERLLNPPEIRPLPAPNRATGLVEIDAVRPFEEFAEKVDRAKSYIRAGDIYQVQVAQRVVRRFDSDPFDAYRFLRALNPSPYMYFLKLPGFTVLGTSPETLVTVSGRELRYRPLAGTRRRGRDSASDQRMEAELLQSEKERAEHVMLVDLGRNDLGRVAEIGSVRVTELLKVERYSHVMHLVSNVVATLGSEYTAMDAFRSCFPAGTVTGAPKIRAMEIIAELEQERRGVYAGAIGYLGFNGNLDSCIAIRTMVIKDGLATAQAAAGIVADSVPEEEFLETRNKLGASIQALEYAG